MPSCQHGLGIMARISGLQQHDMVPQCENRLLNEKVEMVTMTVHESDKPGMKKRYHSMTKMTRESKDAEASMKF